MPQGIGVSPGPLALGAHDVAPGTRFPAAETQVSRVAGVIMGW